MNRIKQAREKQKISQNEIASMLGSTRQAVSLYERGEREPKLEIWQKLANILKVSVPYLQGITDNENPVDETVIEISRHIKDIIKDPEAFDEQNWLTLDRFLEMLQSLKSFSNAKSLLFNITGNLETLTDFDHLEDGKSVNQSELVGQFKQLLEQINQIRDDQNK